MLTLSALDDILDNFYRKKWQTQEHIFEKWFFCSWLMASISPTTVESFWKKITLSRGTILPHFAMQQRINVDKKNTQPI